MLEEEQAKTYKGLNSHVLLPIIIIITTAVIIMFNVSDDFIIGLKPFVVYFYFAILLVYSSVSLFDVFKKDSDKKGKKKTFIIVMSIITLLEALTYLTFYLVLK